MTIQVWLQIITSTITLLGVIFLVYNFFRDPDVKAEKDITILEKECELKHSRLDEIIADLKTGIILIKENHLPHIEKDVNDIKITQMEILTILKERNNK